MIAAEFPATCSICGNIGRWATQPHTGLLERRKYQKGPTRKFTITVQDRKLFLKRIGVKVD